MPADFKPALGAVHACAIPPAAGSEAPGADDVLIITFIASKPTALGAECELWTNLPSDDPAPWDGSSWREVAFVDRSTAVMAPPPEEAADWPLLSLSDAGESPPLLGPAPVRHATIRIPLGELGENRHFEYTYRLRHPDGGIEWLGDGGSNGKFEISVGNGAAAAAATGRWEAIASKAFINGASSEASKASREWSGGEGRLGVTVGPGAEWAGFGIRWTNGLPVAELLPSRHDAPLPIVVLHAVETNVPTLQVTTSLIDPGLPHIIVATAGSAIGCEDDPNAEPSFFHMGQLTQKELVIKGASAGGDDASMATMMPLTAARSTPVVPLWTSGSALTALYHPSRLVIYSSSAGSSAFPAAFRAPPGLGGPTLIYSARTDDIALLEPGKGVLLDLPKQQDVTLEMLDVAHLREVVDADGKPTDILFGPLKAATTVVAPDDKVGRAVFPVAGSTHNGTASAESLTDRASIANDSDAESDDGDQGDDEADDTMVAAVEPSDTSRKSQEHAVAAKATSEQPQTLFGRLFALVWKVWSSMLGIFGLTTADASSGGQETPKESEPTERTPLLPPSVATSGSKSPATATCMPVASSHAVEPPTVARSFARINFSGLPAQAIISVPASASFPTQLRLAGRPLGSAIGEGLQSRPAPSALVYKAGRVEELAKDKDGRLRRFWRVEIGEAAEDTPAGEWEVQAWAASP